MIGIAGAIGAFGGFLIQVVFRQASLGVVGAGQGGRDAGGEARVAQANADWSVPALWVFLGAYVVLRRRDVVLLPAPARCSATRSRCAGRGDGVRRWAPNGDPRHRRRHRRPGASARRCASATRTCAITLVCGEAAAALRPRAPRRACWPASDAPRRCSCGPTSGTPTAASTCALGRAGRPRSTPTPATAELDDGATLRFDRAVLCTGSRRRWCRRSRASTCRGVYAFRDPDDCERDRRGGAAPRGTPP